MDDNVAGKSVCAKCGSLADAGRIFCAKCGEALRSSFPLVAPDSPSPSARSPILADGIGLSLLAAQLIFLFLWLVPGEDGTRFFFGIVAYAVLVAVALAMWHGKEAERFTDASDWLGVLFGSILLGAMSFGVDVLIGGSEYPGISPIKAGTKVGSPFGFILTLFLCPGVTMVAAASVVRSFVVCRDKDISV